MVVQSESTFNPSEAFYLNNNPHISVFKSNKYTHVIGSVYVNTIGGGSWISEFELLTGIDSRLFGYSGYYTHSTLSPYVNKSFIKYLNSKGYISQAFYPFEGNFYYAKKAYFKYGFHKFYENVGGGGWDTTDEIFIDEVISMSNTNDKPFFKYLVTIYNHSPYHCKNFDNKKQFFTTFKEQEEFNEINCDINEFILNQKSTSIAIQKLIGFLEEQEKLTGRPFVLLIYGDHQPHTFTNSKYNEYKKDTYSDRETFLHIISSMPKVIDCCEVSPPHLTLLPTLLSAYVASDIDELYLATNLYAYDKCGTDFMNKGISSGGYGTKTNNKTTENKCPEFNKILTSYHDEKIFNITP